MALKVKKQFENSEVTYDFAGMTLHIKNLSEASQEELKRLKDLGHEAIEETVADKKPKE